MKALSALLLTAAVAITPIAATASEVPESKLDKELMAAGVIDTNYKYKDIDAANKYFAVVYKIVNASLPLNSGLGVNITEFSISPYYSQYTHEYTTDLSAQKAADIQAQLDTPAAFQKLCKEVYLKDRFFAANNHVMKFVYNQNNGAKIADIDISASNCK